MMLSPALYRIFGHLLINTALSSVINYSVWFAITFYAYLETQSVFVTGMIAGMYLVATMLTGIWFGSLVDHHKKKVSMIASNIASIAFYIAALIIYLTAPAGSFQEVSNPHLWALITTSLLGVIAGNLRTIVLPTLVTILIPTGQRDKANGLVGTANGTSFLVTSLISGILVAAGGMLYVLLLALVVLTASILHIWLLPLPEKGIAHNDTAPQKIDLKGTYRLVAAAPGLLALIVFTTFNNFLGGVFMALMDAYGLSMMSVQLWGLLWAVLSSGFILGGILIARKGLGVNPLRTLLLVNAVLWVVTILFPLHGSVIPLAIGMFVYMILVPFAEASEQTVLQQIVPLERQGRVFGFAQSIEQSASPLTAFLMGPLAQFVFIPFMTVGAGAQLIGSWFGTGPARGIALVFILTGFIGLIVTLLAFLSRHYRSLSRHYAESVAANPPDMHQAAKDGLVG